MQVTLTREEMTFAAFGGVTRQINALERRRADQFQPRDYWGTHSLACMAEAAVAKWKDRYWTPFYDADHPPQSPDFKGIEIRSSPDPRRPLTLRERDKPKANSAFILVITNPPVFDLKGWLWGHEAMADEYWQDSNPPPCWFVPQNALHPIGDRT